MVIPPDFTIASEPVASRLGIGFGPVTGRGCATEAARALTNAAFTLRLIRDMADCLIATPRMRGASKHVEPVLEQPWDALALREDAEAF